ncbi:hypothetical protein P8452_39092 [Trifolium repens]|nr:hypothetical protein P8452_39092 [Trifolium repens]
MASFFGFRSSHSWKALSPWERILMHALWTMQIEMSFFLSFIHAAHVFDKMLTWILININIMGSDAKVNQVLKSGAVHLKTTLQQQQEHVTTSLKNLWWLIKTRADALLYLRTTLGEECCDITQVAGTYAIVKEPTIGAFPSTNVAIGTSLADRTPVAVIHSSLIHQL